MRLIIITFFTLLLSSATFAKGKIVGKISDGSTAETLIGVTIIVHPGNEGTVSDFDGNYHIELPSGTYSLEYKYIGYPSKIIKEVVVKDNETATLNVVMNEGNLKTLKEVVVKAGYKKSSINALYALQKNNTAMSSGISADLITKSPDNNTSEVLKRVSGTSVTEGRYVVIRGLNDRYNATTLNGALMTSTEPDRKAFSFDIIPSDLLDNLIINKTATAELSGDFAGGVIQVLTKEIPTSKFMNISLSSGYNSQTTFREFKTVDVQGQTALGYPGKSDDLPAEFGKNYIDYRTLQVTNREASYRAARALKNGYDLKKMTAMPGMGFNWNYGNVKQLKNGNKIGTVLVAGFGNGYTTINGYERALYNTDGMDRFTLENQYRYKATTSLMANLAYVGKSTKIGFKNLFTNIYNNRYYEREGYQISTNQGIYMESTVPDHRQIFNSILNGTHDLNDRELKLDWVINYSRLNAKQEDLRTAFYNRYLQFENGKPIASDSEPYTLIDRNSRRFFSKLNDQNIGAQVSLSVPFKLFGQEQEFKTGYHLSNKSRRFEARSFQYRASINTPEEVKHLPANELLTSEYIGQNFYELSEITNPTDIYDAGALIHSAYVMLNSRFGEKLTANLGLRYENYNQKFISRNASLQSITQAINFSDFLPSMNLGYDFNEKIKLRFSASRTLNRPEFRELAPFQFVDFENFWTVRGNPDLIRANISNLDLKFEFYPRPRQLISIGGFYKYFNNPIEAQLDDQSNLDLMSFYYVNAKSSKALGVELEVRKKLSFVADASWLTNLIFATNLTYIHSTVDLSNISAAYKTRPMQGQSPYLINLSLLYNDDATGLSFSTLFNKIGERILIVGNNTIPSTWEKNGNLLDFQLGKTFLKNKLSVKFTFSDVFNQGRTLYWNTNGKNDFQKGTDRVVQHYKTGSHYKIGLTYKI